MNVWLDDLGRLLCEAAHARGAVIEAPALHQAIATRDHTPQRPSAIWQS